MVCDNYETQRRAAISPLYGKFAKILDRLERALTAPHYCNPPNGHTPVSLTPASSTCPKAGERVRATYICPECSLCWQSSQTSPQSKTNTQPLISAACRGA